MTKPWEETWAVRERGQTDQADAVVDADDANQLPILTSAIYDAPPTRALANRRIKLAAAAPEMARVMLTMVTFERFVDLSARFYCKCCLETGIGSERHDDDCAWLAAMKKAGLR